MYVCRKRDFGQSSRQIKERRIVTVADDCGMRYTVEFNNLYEMVGFLDETRNAY